MLIPDRSLSIPDSVPDHIAAKARELHEAHNDSAIAVNLIEQLVADARMQRVWLELAKRNRKVAEQFASAGINDEAAATGLLEFVFNLGRLTLMLPPADKPAQPFAELAQRLREKAEGLGRDQASQAIAMRLRAEADAYEQITAAAYNSAENIAVQIARWLKSVFGISMYKITAILTSVITGCKISERKVRTWVTADRRNSEPCQK
jgi:hypothetical protein